MIKPEKFKEELFEKLINARKILNNRLFVIEKSLFSGIDCDIRLYMDSEMQHLVTLDPYYFSYVSCESTTDQLAFLDIVPDVKDTGKEVELTNYYYDCEKRRVCTFIKVISK